ncbi:AraC family transcriptional regulator [Actinoplanes sp. KI2]|uniref:helix-turn-helix transcriptional regulator n=1 Tax=Actinoplanes sp. KI2 TaxID=2983315 RepID=UPI0021D589A1|nr:AraC family transcriptional regulator [Actinoplanes sp. KI2]MCU7723872.1 AraC family transcriptional regulator [Actinoplanes sp. KI2]
MLEQDAAGRGRAGAGAGKLPAHVTRLSTRDPDEHNAWLAARYPEHRRRVRPRARGFELATQYAARGALDVTEMRFTAATAYSELPPVSYVWASHAYSGGWLMRWHGREVRVGERGTLLMPPDGCALLNDCCWHTTVRVRLDVVLRVAREQTGLDPAQVRFTGVQPISAAAHRQWLATLEFARRGIYGRTLESPLVLAAAEEAVAASLLAVFPNTAMTTAVRTPRDPAVPAPVRRAMAFIDAHAADPITRTDIAAAARVLPPTLGPAFRRHRDTTPSAYVRRVRLHRAHRQLLAAQPGDGTTIATVAARCGFPDPYRFAAYYRQAYGRPPSQSLHS